METRHHRFWHTAREFLTHWTVAGAILAVTGAAPEHWFADLAHKLPLPFENMPPWLGHLDYRLVALIAGLSIIVGDTLWRHHGAVRSHMPEPAVAIPATEAARADVLPLPDKPSIAVLPFTNLSGDLAQEYFSDGITDDIITELSRFRALFVIASSSTFTYKGKPTDVRQVARELGVRYVLEGSARKSGNHARVSAKLVDAVSGSQLWAEHYDRTLDDVFALQEDVTRGIVTAVAPEVELAEMAHARHGNANDNALHLIWRAQGMMHEGVRRGDASLVLDAIAKARQAIAADPASLAAYNILAWSHWSCHLYRWGPEPAKALDAMSSAIEQMQRIDALDHRTLTICGVVRVVRGEQERGLVDLRRAIEVNPNSSLSLMWLALCEAMGGSAEDARTHANLSLRLKSPRLLDWGGASRACHGGFSGARLCGGHALGRVVDPIGTIGTVPPHDHDREFRAERRHRAGGPGVGDAQWLCAGIHTQSVPRRGRCVQAAGRRGASAGRPAAGRGERLIMPNLTRTKLTVAAVPPARRPRHGRLPRAMAHRDAGSTQWYPRSA